MRLSSTKRSSSARMDPNKSAPALSIERIKGKWFFLCAFLFACFLFWWLPSFTYRVILHVSDPIEDKTIVQTAFAVIAFAAGYLLPLRRNPKGLFSETLLDTCGDFAYKTTLFLALPSLFLALLFVHQQAGVAYGMGGDIPRLYQAVLYTHLFFGFMFLGAINPNEEGWRRAVVAMVVVTLPRLVISLHWQRWFLAQALVPVVFIAVARGWTRLSVKRFLQLALLAVVIVIVPAMTRGDDLSGRDQFVTFMVDGASAIQLFQKNSELDLTGRCPPLLVSMTAKTVPYAALGVCVINMAGKDVAALLDRILTVNDPVSLEGLVSGTGSNYLLELYLTGGMLAGLFGSALFGLSCRLFIGWIGHRSLFVGIWAECLSRALFAPRMNLGYVYEKIPALVLVTFLVVLIVWAQRLLKKEHLRRLAPQVRTRESGITISPKKVIE